MKKMAVALLACVAAVLSAAEGNLLKNGDFKSEKNWALWQAGKKTEWPGTGSIHDGKMELKTCKQACYHQSLKVTPGEKYVFTVTGMNTSKGKAEISLRFLSDKSQWMKEFKSATLPANGEKATVTAEMTVPKGAALMSIQLSASQQEKNDDGKITFFKADLQKK